ncbi:protein FAM234B [Denticeps clupeoides]|uniref:FAM234A/B beta-propeller domain-containing protein n=1 Tax=Denticeps clupeoides TaxID=299321 RepID=A0AAY4D3J1_9TELE|nr:protein FAM234B [Denticeps clupeoides]
MAAALSRALKLPGKKGSELGEYDPLTQADTDDESEDDDLVLNYPRNGGLGRSSNMGVGASELRTGRPSRFIQEEDLEDDEEDEWREQREGQRRTEVEKGKGRPYWSQRDRDAARQDGDGVRPGGAGGIGLGPGADPEGKKARRKGMIRTAFFLVPLCITMLLVLLCAFWLPCQTEEINMRTQWEKELGDVGGVTSPPLTMWDLDNDAIEDLLIGVTQQSNDSQVSSSQGTNKEYSVVALSAVGGEVLWRRPLKESTLYIQCGLQTGAQSAEDALWGHHLQSSILRRGPVCLLIGATHLTAVNGTTGKMLWSLEPGEIVSQVVSVPDLQGDSIPDLLVATLPANQVSDLSLILLSGLTGTSIGQPLTFNISTQGKLMGPLLHETRVGAYYILFGLGAVEAVSLRDIYSNATGRSTMLPKIRLMDPSWEKLRKVNSSLIHLSSDKEPVEFMFPLVAGLCNNRNNLNPMSNVNSSRSDWVLVCGVNKLSVVRERDTRPKWTFMSSAIHSRPSPGHFNEDGTPDLLILQLSSPGVRKVQIIDGAIGHSLWEVDFVCPQLVVEGCSISTTSGQSVFLFWAGDPLQSSKNITKTSPGLATADPVLRKLFLLHPTYPTILLELASTTDTVLSAAVSYEEQRKDASYITVSSRPTSGRGPGAHVVKSLSLKAAITEAQIRRLGEESKTTGPAKPGAFEVKKFFRDLCFKHR